MIVTKKLLRYFVNKYLNFYNKNRLKPTYINVGLEKLYWLSRFGYMPDFKNPKTMNEYICYHKLFGDFEKLANAADKYEIREKVQNEVGGQYLLELYDYVEDLDLINEERYHRYPEKFAAKPSHASGRVFINKTKDFEIFKSKTKEFLEEFGNTKNELHYKRIKPRLIIEELIQPSNGVLFDYKFWVFHGKVEFVDVAEDLLNYKKSYKDAGNRRVYTKNWKTAEFQKGENYANFRDKPNHFDEMVAIAEALSKGWPFMRLDLYYYDDQIKFGEMTPTPGAGRKGFFPLQMDRTLYIKYLSDNEKQ